MNSGPFLGSLLAVAFLAASSPNQLSAPKEPGAIAPQPSSTTTSPGDPGPVRTGAWGGEHISMNVTDSGATLQLDCAHATIDQPMRADPDGYFRLVGAYTAEGG